MYELLNLLWFQESQSAMLVLPTGPLRMKADSPVSAMLEHNSLLSKPAKGDQIESKY